MSLSWNIPLSFAFYFMEYPVVNHMVNHLLPKMILFVKTMILFLRMVVSMQVQVAVERERKLNKLDTYDKEKN